MCCLEPEIKQSAIGNFLSNLMFRLIIGGLPSQMPADEATAKLHMIKIIIYHC